MTFLSRVKIIEMPCDNVSGSALQPGIYGTLFVEHHLRVSVLLQSGG